MKNSLLTLSLFAIIVACLPGCKKINHDEVVNVATPVTDFPFCVDIGDPYKVQSISAGGINQLVLDKNSLWKTGQTIRIRFLNGSDELQKKVEKAAKEWTEYGNFEFTFTKEQASDIRILFIKGYTSSSYIGRRPSYDPYPNAPTAPMNVPTMWLGLLENPTIENIRQVTLHEFGHALGMLHEHQHPKNDIQWNKPYVYDFYMRNYGWSREVVDYNIFKRYSVSHTQFSKYDPLSIMHYPIPQTMTLDGYFVNWNMDLSDRDKCYVRRVYPFSHDRNYFGTGYGVRGGRGWYIGDFNGDGKADILRYKNSNGGAEVLLSGGGSFKIPKEWSGYGVRGGEGWYVGDFNGDGKDDIMRYMSGYGGAEVCLSTGSSFQSPKKWSGYGTRGGEGWYVGDYNGDGKDDILRFLSEKGGAEVCLSNGRSFSKVVLWTAYKTNGGRGWYVGDFNGDGKDDIMRYMNEYGGAEVLLSIGASFAPPKKWSGFSVHGGLGWYVGDYNGDGKDDIMSYMNGYGGAEVLLSRGTSFGEANKWNGKGVPGTYGWYVGDYNGDGKNDICRYINEHGGAEVFLSRNNKFASTVVPCD